MAGERGFEPLLTDPESAVLPIRRLPIYVNNIVNNIYKIGFDLSTDEELIVSLYYLYIKL